ncbi:MAG TPA: hypothetical protein VM348_00780 [Brevundimonas sp.]|nr:hypothetical protein [Brevundimonas sp.]
MIILVYLALGPLQRWVIGDIYVDSIVEGTLEFLFMGWLVLRSDRWWPFVATAATGLIVLVHVFTVVTDISWGAALSARVGLELLEYAALLAGVAERWMAGERPIIEGLRWRERVRPAS